MKPDRDYLVQELFEAALERRSEDREALLERECGGDETLRLEVESLLAADARAEGFLETPALAGAIGYLADRPAAGLIGRRVGRYRLDRVLATGGMGSVYAADQEAPHRTVAVKVVRASIATPTILRRFKHESEVLAGLRHPGIAQVYEAGVFEDGAAAVPYFAMEYVPDARPITAYAEEQRLDIDERLDLFAEVCDAVHHGHQKGVVHRDLKPANILVDAAGQPKIIDFGVARSFDADIALTTLQTDVGELVGTVQYMSPEQCAGDPHDIDIRTDVYALGVVLYELLGGRPPYDVTKLPVFEAVRVVREAHPARLGTLDTGLRGDIETIVAKALEPERERRYQSAHELASDVRSYRAGQPISARPPSVAYQLRLFARRQRALVGAVAAVFLALVVGMVGTSIGLVTANRQREAAEAADLVAQREATEARTALGFLESMLRSADPQESRGREVTVRTILDRAGEQIELGALAAVPEVEASVRTTLGLTYMSLGLWDDAEPHLDAALDIRRRVLGADHPAVAESLMNLARARCWADGYWADPARGAPPMELFQEAIDLRRRVLGADHARTLESMRALAAWLRDLGRYEESEALMRRVLERQRRILGDDDPAVASTLRALGTLLAWSDDYPGAEPLMREALAIHRGRGDDDLGLIASMASLADVLRANGGYAEAVALNRDGLRITQAIYGSGTLQEGSSKRELAKSLIVHGDLREAETLLRQDLEIRIRVRGNDHVITGMDRMILGVCLTRMTRYAEAEQELLEAERIVAARMGPHHTRTGWVVKRLADLYEQWNKPERAAAYLARLAEADAATPED